MRTGFRLGLAACLCLLAALPARAAEWSCQAVAAITGGRVFVTVDGDGEIPHAVSGRIELSTAGIPPPLGLRNGTLEWIIDQPETSSPDAILGLEYRADFPLSADSNWGVARGAIVPTRLSVLVPLLRNPYGGPVRFDSVTLVTGNGIYTSNSDWSVRTSPGGMVFSNAPEGESVLYSRELLQLIAADITEPIVLFVTPSVLGPMDSIAAFEASGIAQAPARIVEITGQAILAGRAGQCPAPPPEP